MTYLLNSLNKAGALFVTAKINGYDLTFDIDTGSTHNIIFDFVYKALQDNFDNTDKTLNVFGIDGKKQKSSVASTDLYFDDVAHKTEFQIINANKAVNNIQKAFGVQLHGILEVQFLKDNNCVIDFANKTIKIGE